MSTGSYISGVGHAGLIGFVILGWGFSSDPLPFEITDVSVVSGAEYAALTAGLQPEVEVEEPPAPEAPAIEDTPIAPATPEEPTETATAPPLAPEPEVETPPEPPELTPPPVAEVVEVAPEAPTPPAPETPTNIVIGTSLRPQPRPAPRIAPEAVAPPEPEVAISDVFEEAVTESPDAPTEADVEETEATSPDEAVTETVTEADEPEDGEVISLAPSTSVRPPVRPTPPATAPTPETATAETPNEATAGIDELLAGLNAETPAAPTPTGPPLTASEADGLRIAVQDCWSLPISTDAQRTTVVVGFTLSRDGAPSTVELISSNGSTNEATRAAFEAARRAIIRCARSGYDLPAEKYDQWQNVEITFNPESMRLR